MNIKCNCCDGIYNSFDVHFTSRCDNKCAHCVDTHFNGTNISNPDVDAIIKTVVENQNGVDDILFLGGEPCLYLEELLVCVKEIRKRTNLDIYVTTAVPKVCYDKSDLFYKMIDMLNGVNLSVQHYKEEVADKIRNTVSKFDRQKFYRKLPNKHKIRINLNIVKLFLYTKEDISACLRHYDNLGFNSIKLSEIQHGKDFYVSFADTFGIKMDSSYSYGCQTYLDMSKILPGFSTPVLLKRSCFLCEETLKASISDGIKIFSKLFKTNTNRYGVIYENGILEKGWI